MRALIAAMTAAFLLAAPAAARGALDLYSAEPGPDHAAIASIGAGELGWSLAAGRDVQENALNATLVFLHRLAQRVPPASSLRADSAPGYAGFRMSVRKRRLRLHWRFRF